MLQHIRRNAYFNVSLRFLLPLILMHLFQQVLSSSSSQPLEKITCNYFNASSVDDNSCDDLPLPMEPFSFNTVRLTGGVDALYTIPTSENYCSSVKTSYLPKDLQNWSSMCSQLFCNPTDPIVTEIFGNLTLAITNSNYFPTRFISTDLTVKMYEDENQESEKFYNFNTTLPQLAKLYNYCLYCKKDNPSFSAYHEKLNSSQCTLPFTLIHLFRGDDLTQLEVCGQEGSSVPMLDLMTYSSLTYETDTLTPTKYFYFPVGMCYCGQSQSFSSRCDIWSDSYYTNTFQNGIRSMFMVLYLIFLMVMITIVLVPLLYKRLLAANGSFVNFKSSGIEYYSENSNPTFRLSEPVLKRKYNYNTRERSSSGLSDQFLVSSPSDTHEPVHYGSHSISEGPPRLRAEDPAEDQQDSNQVSTRKQRRWKWKPTLISLLTSWSDFRIIATLIAVSTLISGFFSLIPSFYYNARLVMISVDCILSLIGLIPIVFQWLVVLKKVERENNKEPSTYKSHSVTVLAVVVFGLTILLFVGYILVVALVSGNSTLLLARYIMLVVLFLYIIAIVPLLVIYGVQVYFKILKKNNEIRFFQFKVCFVRYVSTII